MAAETSVAGEPERLLDLPQQPERTSDITGAMLESSWMKEVLPETYNQSLKLKSLYAIRIPSALCYRALKAACTDDWLRTHYTHLKRVKRLGPTRDSESNGNDKTGEVIFLLGNAPDIPEGLSGLLGNNYEPFLVDVPEHEPLTREQYREWTQVWPITYRQPSWRPMYFLDNAAVKAVIFNLLDRACSTTDSLCSASCVLTLSGSIVAEAFLSQPGQPRSGHPLISGHGPMVALQRLSRHVMELQKRESNAKLVQEHPENRLRTGRRIIFDSPGQRPSHKRSHKELDDSTLCPPPNSDELFLSSSARLTSAHYYAQGLVAFLSCEPCVMCSMALLHSRIGCVVIPKHNQNIKFGGLGGLFSLHSEGRLNHKFHVLCIDLTTRTD